MEFLFQLAVTTSPEAVEVSTKRMVVKIKGVFFERAEFALMTNTKTVSEMK